MKKSQLFKIERILVRFQEGDLYTPVKVEGTGLYHSVTKRLEELRISMLGLVDNEVEVSRRANKSIASVAHDMKTPLAIISGYAECLSDGMDDKDYANLIIQKANQMNDMVIGLVESSHSAIQKDASHRELKDSRVLFGKIVEKLRPLAEAKHIKLKVGKIPSERIRVDEPQMERVMQNLLSNAIKYSPENSVVKVSFCKWGKNLRIKVKDKGIGISKESLPLVFDQFYTEDKSRTGGNSQGVGLYVVKEIVTEHGGEVSVKSKKGKGTRFYVTLPIEEDPNKKTSFTSKFNNKTLFQKSLIIIFFGWIMASVYRVARYFETRCVSTLIAGILAMFLFIFFWPADWLSILFYGEITFLAE